MDGPAPRRAVHSIVGVISQRNSAERSKNWRSFLLDTNGPKLQVSCKVRIGNRLICGQINGRRDRDRTGDSLLAKTRKKIYLVGSLGFVLCLGTRFCTLFGSKWTQVGPKFFDCTPRMRQFSMGILNYLCSLEVRAEEREEPQPHSRFSSPSPAPDMPRDASRYLSSTNSDPLMTPRGPLIRIHA